MARLALISTYCVIVLLSTIRFDITLRKKNPIAPQTWPISRVSGASGRGGAFFCDDSVCAKVFAVYFLLSLFLF